LTWTTLTTYVEINVCMAYSAIYDVLYLQFAYVKKMKSEPPKKYTTSKLYKLLNE